MEIRLSEAWAIGAVLALLMVAAVLGLELARGQVPAVPENPPSKFDAYLIELDKKALDNAYHEQIKLLFSVWLKDDISATHRVTTGLRIARRAYIMAAGELEKREQRQQRK